MASGLCRDTTYDTVGCGPRHDATTRARARPWAHLGAQAGQGCALGTPNQFFDLVHYF